MKEKHKLGARVFGKNRAKECLFFGILLMFALVFTSQSYATDFWLNYSNNFSISNQEDIVHTHGNCPAWDDSDSDYCVVNLFDDLCTNSPDYWNNDAINERVNITLKFNGTGRYTVHSIKLQTRSDANSWDGFNIWISDNLNNTPISLTNWLNLTSGDEGIDDPTTMIWNITTPFENAKWLFVQSDSKAGGLHALCELGINATYSVSNLTVQPKDHYLNTSLTVFNVTINGTTYNSTSGSIMTKIPTSSHVNLTINFTAPNFLQQIVTNYNVSLNGSNFNSANMTFYQSRHAITAFLAPVNTTAINNFQIEAGGLSFNTTTGSTIVNTTWNTSTRLDFNTTDYQTLNWTTTGLTNDGHIFNPFQKNTFDFNIYDELTWGLLDFRNYGGTDPGTNNASVELISSVFSGNYTTDNGSLIVSLLTPADYTIRFKDLNGLFYTRFQKSTLSSQSYNQLDLYMLNNTYSNAINVTGTVLTLLNDELEGATITVTKYDRAANAYKTVEKVDTNFEGQAELHLTTDEYYKFIVEYEGVTRLTTDETYIYEDSLSFVVDLGATPAVTYYKSLNISTTLVFNNNTGIFTYTFNDPNNRFSQTCLKIYRINISTGNTLYNNSCVTTHAGTINLGVQIRNGTTYQAKGTATIDGEEITLISLYYTYVEDAGFGNIAVFIAIMLCAAFALMSRWNPFIAIILTPLPLVFLAILGIITIPVAIVASIVAAFGVVAIYIGGKS